MPTAIPEAPAIIMVIDDQPANLKLMQDMLKLQGYQVRSFPRGVMALQAAADQPPNLILLDINMPEMNGFEVCERLKADKKLASIPVIFLSALNETEDKVKAFHAGGVDYVTKPFQLEEVQARVETHLQLQRARLAERELLEDTLNGSIRTLAQLIHLAGPAMSARSEAIRAMVRHMSAAQAIEHPLQVEHQWQYDLAATLCLIGCVAMPIEAFERAYAGEAVSEDEQQMFCAHPDSGAALLANIPRLESVAEMIRQQQIAGNIDTSNPVHRGACMLRIAIELDRKSLRAIPLRTALLQLRTTLRSFPLALVDAMNDYTPPETAFEIRRLPVHELRSAMVLEDDVLTKDGGYMVLHKGAQLNATLIERIANFARTRGIVQPIHVRVIRPEGSSRTH
jgi:DNA-binding response OmpR family regulator